MYTYEVAGEKNKTYQRCGYTSDFGCIDAPLVGVYTSYTKCQPKIVEEYLIKLFDIILVYLYTMNHYMEDKMEYIIESFVSVGKIKFGMTRDEVIDIFGKEPVSEYKSWRQKINLMYSDECINIILNKKGIVDEITFTEGNNDIIFEEKSLYGKDVIKFLSSRDKPIKLPGDIIFINIGIGFLQYKHKEDKAITVFAKELKKEYLKLSMEK
ncbi:MAG: hypothetical protein LBU76_09445 [Azoarcus sp.]|jgi:hypothetical protein|nr:hypothetical protein [Azoarcus sp.]